MSPPRRTLIAALAALVATQAVVVAATLAVPVLAPEVSAALGVPETVVGWHMSGVFAAALAFAQVSPRLVARFGGIALSRLTALVAALALVATAALGTPGLALGAVLLGAAYAQSNTASGVVLAALTTARSRAFVFSLKQVAVPLGGALAGALLPPLSAGAGWRPALLALAAAALIVALLARAPEGPRAAAGPAPSVRAVLRGSRPVRLLAGTAFAFSAVQFTTAALLVACLVTRHGVDPVRAGALLGAAMLGAVALRIGLGALAGRIGAAPLLIALGLAMAAAATALALAGSPGTAEAAGVALVAAAYGWNGLFLAEVARLGAPQVGAATAAGMSAVFLGGAAMPVLAALVIGAGGGYAAAFLGLAGAALAAVALVALARPAP